MTRFLFDVKFWQMDHIFAKFASVIFCLICYYVCAETTTVVLLALILYKIKFSGFVHNLSFGWALSHFGHLLWACAETAIMTTSGVKFDLKFDFSVSDFLYVEKFWKLDHDFMYFSQFSAAPAQKRPDVYFRSNF